MGRPLPPHHMGPHHMRLPGKWISVIIDRFRTQQLRSSRLIRYHLALICAPYALLVFLVILMVGISAFGCNPFHREIAVTPEGKWIGLPEKWNGKVPAIDSLHPAYLANRARARTLGVCP